MTDEGRDQIFDAHIPGAGSPMSPSTGQLPHASQLSQILLLVKGKVNSLACRRMYGQGGAHLSLAPTTRQQTKEAVSALPLSCPQDWLTHVPFYRINSTVLPRQGAAAGEVLGQIPDLLKVLRGEGHLSFTHTTAWQRKGA